MELQCADTYRSIMIETDGRAGHCCIQNKITKPDWSQIDDLDAWYRRHKKMSTIRNDLDTGVRNAACASCWSMENAGLVSRRQLVTPEMPEEVTIEKVDVRLSNKCNLQCRMCHGGSSDQIASRDKLLLAKGLANGLVVEHEPQHEHKEKLLDLIFALPNLKRITFAGGEPFIMPEVLAFLERMSSSGRTDVEVRITTN